MTWLTLWFHTVVGSRPASNPPAADPELRLAQEVSLEQEQRLQMIEREADAIHLRNHQEPES